jgi:hypothetical protein
MNTGLSARITDMSPNPDSEDSASCLQFSQVLKMSHPDLGDHDFIYLFIVLMQPFRL